MSTASAAPPAAVQTAPNPAGLANDPSTWSMARKFLIFGVMAFGQFLALIDIQIVAVALVGRLDGRAARGGHAMHVILHEHGAGDSAPPANGQCPSAPAH